MPGSASAIGRPRPPPSDRLAPVITPSVFGILGAVLGFVGTATAQIDRYELGLRLRAFERRLAATADEGRRTAAFAELDRAVQAFFRLDTRTVAKALAAAEGALAGGTSPAGAFADSLQLQLHHRLHDPATGPLAFEVSAAYPVDVPRPEPLLVTVRLTGDARDRATRSVTELPIAGELDLRDATAGDHTVVWTIRAGDHVLGSRSLGLSLAPDLERRLARIRAAAGGRDPTPTSLESGTLDLLGSLLAGMTRERREETVLPGARLLADAEALAAAVAAGEPFYGPSRSGQHWLRVPVGKTTAIVRLLVPPEPAAPCPLVIALHGAGGSENLFFDGHGDGAIVGECARRGWFLVAPRCGALGGPDLAALVDALAARWPIDPNRVMVVGHSMGAALAMAAAGRSPGRFRAVAVLGGGGAPPRAGDAGDLRFFVGVGSRDFARAGALRLHESLAAAALPSTLREYPSVEHLAIVQIALPDVFAWFDRTLAPR